MSTTDQPAETVVREIVLDLIDSGGNVRDLDPAHVIALAGSMALRGQLAPITVRPAALGRYALVAGEHRCAAAAQLGWTSITVIVRDVEQASGDQGAENVLRKQLTPLEEARAVKRMLDDGYTPDGAATVLGWSKRLITARARILELPGAAQTMVGTGEIPASGIDVLLQVRAVSPKLCELVADVLSEQEQQGNPLGGQLVRDPGWVVRQAVGEHPDRVFAATLGGTLYLQQVDELKLGKQTQKQYVEACELHDKLDRYAYGPPPVRFTEQDVDQARAAGVLLELGSTRLVLDRDVYRELARQAVARTLTDLQTRVEARAQEKAASRAPAAERTPRQQLDREHRAELREHAVRAHGVNLDLGAALLDGLASVDPASMDVARFFAFGLLGPDTSPYLGTADNRARTIAANGLRLVLGEFRTTETPILRNGQPGRTKVIYSDPEAAVSWLWTFVDGAKSAGDLYGRALVVFAAQHYAHQIALPTSQRRPSGLPSSRKDAARKALEKLAKPVLPATHGQLTRAIDREARDYHRRQADLERAARGAVDSPTDADDGVDAADGDEACSEDLADHDEKQNAA